MKDTNTHILEEEKKENNNLNKEVIIKNFITDSEDINSKNEVK